ncbi:MAG TPA: glycosyltransferase [Candidatus Anoxymicrobiaceae bacterium]
MKSEQTGHLTDTSEGLNGQFRRTIVIPAWDEEHRIGPILKEYLEYYGDDTEIMVVLNGCRDRTRDIAFAFLEEYKNLRLVEDTNLIGKGGALIVGFRLARGEIVAYVDADGSTYPQNLDKLIKAVGDEAGVIGSRWIDKSLISVKQSLYRRMASRVFNVIVRTLFRMPYLDTQCGAKAFKREAIESIADELGTTNYAFDVNILYLLHRKGFTITEFPITWEDRPGTKIKMRRDAPIMLGAVIRMRIKHSRFKDIVR